MRFKLLIILVFVFGDILAQDSAYSLKEAIQLALMQNLDIQIAKNDLEMAQVNNNWGNAGALPTLSASFSNNESVVNIDQKLSNGTEINRNNVSSKSLNGNLNFSWRIFNGLRVRATKERFDILEQIGGIALNRQIDQVTFDVTNVYYNLVRLNKQIIATLAIIELSRERLKIAETRFNVGSGAKTDMLQARIDLNAQEVNLKNILRQVENTKATMNALLKRSPENPFITKDEQFNIPRIIYSDLTAKMEKQNPQLLIAQKERLNVLAERKIIQSQRLPNLTLNSNAVLNKQRSAAGFFLSNQTFGPNIGLGLAVPLFNGNANRTQLKVNTIQQKQQDLQIEQIKVSLQRDMLIAFQEYQNAVEVADVEGANMKLAEENNMISTERFKKLQSNSIELRQAQLSLIEAQDRYINAQYRAQVAAAVLYFISGEISLKQ